MPAAQRESPKSDVLVSFRCEALTNPTQIPAKVKKPTALALTIAKAQYYANQPSDIMSKF